MSQPPVSTDITASAFDMSAITSVTPGDMTKVRHTSAVTPVVVFSHFQSSCRATGIGDFVGLNTVCWCCVVVN